MKFRPFLPMVQSPTGRIVRFKAELPSVACDGTGVTGGSAPLASATVKMRGIMAAGTDCSGFLGSIAIEKGVINVRWRGLDAGRRVALGVSQATIASASFDSGSNSFVIVTAPIVKGAFVGSTLSFTKPFVDIPEYMRVCNLPPPPSGYASFNWGPPMNDIVPTLTVQ